MNSGVFGKMMGLAGALVVAVWALGARADYTAGSFTHAQTRFGELQVVGPMGSRRMVFNGTDLGLQDHDLTIDGVWALEGGGQDWVVISTRHGGNLCDGGETVMLRLSAQGAVMTARFGICGGGPRDIRVFADAVELDMSDPAPFVTHRVFRFDGTRLTETPIHQSGGEAAAGAGQDVLRWLTSHPHGLTQDPGEQARFAPFMTPAQITDLGRRMSGPGDTRQVGTWVVGRACQAHQCNLAQAIWAIRIADGVPMALFLDSGRAGQAFGPAEAFNDPTLQQIIREAQQ